MNLYVIRILCLKETKTDDLDTIELLGYFFKMQNRKENCRKSGGMILTYIESLENYIELLDIESKYVLWFNVSSLSSINVLTSSLYNSFISELCNLLIYLACR